MESIDTHLVGIRYKMLADTSVEYLRLGETCHREGRNFLMVVYEITLTCVT